MIDLRGLATLVGMWEGGVAEESWDSRVGGKSDSEMGDELESGKSCDGTDGIVRGIGKTLLENKVS